MRLNQVSVGSTNLDRSEAFYRTLGLNLVVKDEHYLRLECPSGESTFSVADMPWLWREARLRDPDGHRLCLLRARENRKHPPWRLPSA